MSETPGCTANGLLIGWESSLLWAAVTDKHVLEWHFPLATAGPEVNAILAAVNMVNLKQKLCDYLHLEFCRNANKYAKKCTDLLPCRPDSLLAYIRPPAPPLCLVWHNTIYGPDIQKGQWIWNFTSASYLRIKLLHQKSVTFTTLRTTMR